MIILKLYLKKTRSLLVFFCVLSVFISCNKNLDSKDVTLLYEAGKAIGISFPINLASDDMRVYLEENPDTPVLGTHSWEDRTYIFKPVIPFSEGRKYLLYSHGMHIANFSIATNSTTEIPELVVIYPTTDTVPENLLKMYFQFSKPMQEVGSALDFITVTNTTTNEIVDVFLALESELWNPEHTRLTLWLDPGRIKTDLIPNKEKGLPILKNNKYTIKIDSTWKDASGTSLDQSYEKKLIVVDRDDNKPVVNLWGLIVTKHLLTIDFKEPLDGILAPEVFSIQDSKGTAIAGNYELNNNEQTLKFKPGMPFEKGDYTIIIASRLEDLAGNNLNHPFDNDLAKKMKPDNSETKTIQFTIQ